MTNTPDLELRKRMAEKLGWTDVGSYRNGLYGLTPSPQVIGRVVPRYELSLDACFRDAVPWARERGWRLHLLCQALNGQWHCIFDNFSLGRIRGIDNDAPAKAFCEAVVKLEDVEGKARVCKWGKA